MSLSQGHMKSSNALLGWNAKPFYRDVEVELPRTLSRTLADKLSREPWKLKVQGDRKDCTALTRQAVTDLLESCIPAVAAGCERCGAAQRVAGLFAVVWLRIRTGSLHPCFDPAMVPPRPSCWTMTRALRNYCASRDAGAAAFRGIVGP